MLKFSITHSQTANVNRLIPSNNLCTGLIYWNYVNWSKDYKKKEYITR
ncbi:MAG: hypothetical protein Q8940_22045 [Bacteroidota bacterium]|nr:hypothetical protein [Bacteroidota bacterium]